MERPYLHPSGLAQGSALRLDSRHRPALSRRVRPDKWQKSNDPEWQVLWSRASAAGASGRLLPALRLFSAAIAAHLTAGEPYEEAGTLSANFSRGLAEVDQLYATYCADLNQPRELCPAQILHRRFVDGAAMSAVDPGGGNRQRPFRMVHAARESAGA
jgi:hypothetical protein